MYKLLILTCFEVLILIRVPQKVQAQPGKPDPEFYRPFRCQQSPSTKSNPALIFNSRPTSTYRFSSKPINSLVSGAGKYPVFMALSPRHKAAADVINRLLRQCVKDEGIFILPDADPTGQKLAYEIVMMNESFFSIHFASLTCGNRCHRFTTSFNYDLVAHRRVTNCMLLAKLGISDREFEKAMRARWSKLAILDYEGNYPTFKEVKAKGGPVGGEESTDMQSNRYSSGPFDQTLDRASILPVIYHGQYYLRVGLNLNGFNLDHVGYTDWPLNNTKIR